MLTERTCLKIVFSTFNTDLKKTAVFFRLQKNPTFS